MSTITFDDLVQGTDEWLAARCGVLTASVIGRLVTSTLKVANNATSRGLAATIAAERITDLPDDTYVSYEMMRGEVEESAARDPYAKHHAPVTEIGFMVRDFGSFRIGYSPDGLVGEPGLLEIKSRKQRVHVEHILSGQVPAENMAQIQTGLLVSRRDWCDYVSYSSGMALWVHRVYPDPEWQDALLTAAEKFEHDVSVIVDRYERAVDGLPVADITPDYDTEMTF